MAASIRTPVTLLVIGGLLVILTIGISIPAFLGPEEVILTQDDFGFDQDGGFKATVPSEDLMTTVDVRIWGRTDQAIGINLMVKDGGGSIIKDVSQTTPMDVTVIINGMDGSYSFIVMIGDGYTLNDIFIEITQNEPTEVGIGLCCGAMVLGPTSAILILVGLVMLLKRAVGGKKSKPAPVPEYHSTWDDVNKGYGAQGPAVHPDGIRIDPYYQRSSEVYSTSEPSTYPAGEGGPGNDTDFNSGAQIDDDQLRRPRMAPPPPPS